MVMISYAPLLVLALPLAPINAAPAPPPRGAAAILAAAPASAWRRIVDDDLLVMDLAGGTRAVIALAPAFAPVHVANIRALARAHWWDGTSINRVQDNYVVQWGDATEKKPLPPGLATTPPAEYEQTASRSRFKPLPYHDAYAPEVGHADGWPIARDGHTTWLTHCYGMVGVGRNNAPDTGTGAELYAVIGHAPRHLDRNIALVGRVVSGMETLAAYPRGTASLGFYATAAERTKIVRVRLAGDLPHAERPAIEVLRTDTGTFAAWVGARANRKDDFFIRPAGAVDICNTVPPTRIVSR